MNWNNINDLIPIVGATVNVVLTWLAIRNTSLRFRKYALVAITLLAASSIALFWSDTPELSNGEALPRVGPPLLAYLGLWLMKLKVMIAGVGFAMLNRFSDTVLRPILYTMVLLGGAVSALMTAALLT